MLYLKSEVLMKKIILLTIALLILVVSCGKTDRGTYTVKNNSGYEVTFVFWSSLEQQTFLTVAPNNSKSINWVDRIKYGLSSPLRVVSYKEIENTIIVTDNTDFYKATVNNYLPCDIVIVDNNQYFIVNADKKYSKNYEVSIPAGKENAELFLLVTPAPEYIFIKEQSLTINEKVYEINKENSTYFIKTTDTNTGTKNLKEIKIDVSPVAEREYKIKLY